MGGLEVVDEGAGGVLPHERTTPKASTDRLDLTRGDAVQPVTDLGAVARRRADRPAHARRRADGVGHASTASTTSSNALTDPERIAAIRDAIGSDDVLIADGHHRYGIARTYRDEVRRSTGSTRRRPS